MKFRNAPYSMILLAAALMFAASTPGVAATVSAASCAQTAVQAAIGAASNGDTVAIPAGSCSWGAFAISKGIHLKGAGSSATVVSITGAIDVTRTSSHSFEMSGFKFTKSGGGAGSHMFNIGGSSSAAPPLIHNNIFTAQNAGVIRYETNGGVIYSNTFNGTWDESGIQHKMDNDTQSWSSPDSMGTRDTDGRHNLYVEDNTFNNLPNQGTDFDDAARVVFRHNTLNNSSFNTHGLDTSPIGVRHFEIYGNEFRYADASVNQNWQIWLRGGTGVIYNNRIDNLIGQMWGDKSELHLSVRAVADGAGAGCCTTYPCRHQVGQNHDGGRQFTDAIRTWNNTGTMAWRINNGWTNQCGQNMADYIQSGRDIVFASTAKAGYTPYPYPHPLRSGTDEKTPAPPTGLSVNP